MDPELQKSVKQLVKLGIVFMSIVVLILLLKYLLPFLGKIVSVLPQLLLPFIIALIIALIIEPVVALFERLRLPRALAVAISLILTVGGFIALLILLISKIVSELAKFYPHLTLYSSQMIESVAKGMANVQLFYIDLDVQLQQTIQSYFAKTLLWLQDVANATLNFLLLMVSALPNTVVMILIATVATFFIVKDRALIRRFFWYLIPSEDLKNTTQDIIAQLFTTLTGFIKAYSVLVSITAISTMICLKILGVNYVFTLGIITGILDILPILGPGLLFIPWIIWELFFGSTATGIGLLVVYLVISMIRQFLEPKILGDTIGLHPLATLSSLYIGLQLGGVIGMILGPVLLVIIISCYRAGLFDNVKLWRKDGL